MIQRITGIYKSLANRNDPQRTAPPVTRQIEHANDTVLNQRPGCDFYAGCLDECIGSRRRNVCIVKQRDPHVNVE